MLFHVSQMVMAQENFGEVIDAMNGVWDREMVLTEPSIYNMTVIPLNQTQEAMILQQ